MFLAEFDSVCQPNPTTMQQLIDKGAVTSGRGQGKISSKELCMGLSKIWMMNGLNLLN